MGDVNTKLGAIRSNCVNKFLVFTGMALASGVASAADYSGLTVDTTGIDTAAIAIGTALLGVLAVFWGVRKIMSLVG